MPAQQDTIALLMPGGSTRDALSRILHLVCPQDRLLPLPIAKTRRALRRSFLREQPRLRAVLFAVHEPLTQDGCEGLDFFGDLIAGRLLECRCLLLANEPSARTMARRPAWSQLFPLLTAAAIPWLVQPWRCADLAAYLCR